MGRSKSTVLLFLMTVDWYFWFTAGGMNVPYANWAEGTFKRIKVNSEATEIADKSWVEKVDETAVTRFLGLSLCSFR